MTGHRRPDTGLVGRVGLVKPVTGHRRPDHGGTGLVGRVGLVKPVTGHRRPDHGGTGLVGNRPVTTSHCVGVWALASAFRILPASPEGGQHPSNITLKTTRMGFRNTAITRPALAASTITDRFVNCCPVCC